MRRMTWLLAALITFAAVLGACGPGEEELASQDQEQEWVTVQEEHAKLVAARDELAVLRQRIAGGAEADEAAGLSAEEVLAGWNQEAADRESQVNDTADEFSVLLVEFINKNAGYEGDETTELQQAAIRLKSSEDIELAREYVTKGGDYRRAITILENARAVDFDNSMLSGELENLQRLRYMDEERFSRIEKNMTEEDVRTLIGQVFHGNVRPYPGDVVAWLYPKQEGAAAAVFFREQGGMLKVYNVDFNAVKTARERAE